VENPSLYDVGINIAAPMAARAAAKPTTNARMLAVFTFSSSLAAAEASYTKFYIIIQNSIRLA
jgi:hypothetical protein